MKIALMTIWHCGNYGAEMQTYATVKALRMLGHDVEVIDYRLFEHSRKLKSQIGKAIRALTPAQIKFEIFYSKYIIHQTKHYRNIEQLKNDPPQADVYMTGSDQVWNEDIVGNRIAAYLLDFGSKSTKRIAYAPSIGVSTWNFSSQFTKYISQHIPMFSSISCREKTGTELLHKYIGIDVQNVLDPTLLHDNYKEITGRITEKKTLAYYPLSAGDTYSLEFCKNLAAEKELKFVNANPYTFIPFVHIAWQRHSVTQWLQTIASAQLVVTGSFHGLAFSLIYRKQFIIINNNKTGRNSRITDLLTYLGLSNRLFTSVEDAEASKIWEIPIDYNTIEEKLSRARKESWDYLKKNLS